MLGNLAQNKKDIFTNRQENANWLRIYISRLRLCVEAEHEDIMQIRWLKQIGLRVAFVGVFIVLHAWLFLVSPNKKRKQKKAHKKLADISVK